MTTIRESTLPNLIYRGKVRDTHDIGDGQLLMVASDRISAFDIVLPNTIPDKGAVLCQISAFWFDKTKHIIPNHLIALGNQQTKIKLPPNYARQSMIVKRAKRVDIEAIVRGYITGSAWSEYKKSGTVSGLPAPNGLREGDKFPEPIFTPTTKAEQGHDENMSYEQVEALAGKDVAKNVKDTAIAVYNFAHDYAFKKGTLIADTKMEFGFIDGQLSLIDELLTPDSSRFWDTSGYAPGKSQPNFDKQFVRDWLNAQGWNKEPPAPVMPDDIVEKTRQRYLEAYRRLTGKSLT